MVSFKFSRTALARHHVRSPDEKALVRRLDIFLLTFGCLSQVIKYLDQQNINNAYVSGMKEDLNLFGNELNLFTTYFNAAYCVMLIPSQIILTYVRPSFWLPGLEIAWGVLTGLIAMCNSAKQIYVLRVFLGLCESSAWPGMMTLFMYWYTPTELAKRMGFYQSCQAAGQMMSGALQTAITNTMEGHHGLAGWRWLFVINAIITVVWGFLGFFMIPDLPNRPNPRAFWFKKVHAELSMERLARNGRAEPKRMTWAGVKRTFSGWVVYFIAVLYIATVLGTYGYVYFSLFLKALKRPDGSPRWSVSQVNAIPIGGSAINVVFVWVWALLSDFLETRWTLIVLQGIIGIIPCIIMSIWTRHPTSVDVSAAYASYFIAHTCLGTAPLIFAWLSDLIPQDPEARTLVVGVAVAGYYAISAWSQVLVWPASQAPYYRYGWQSALALLVLVIVMTCVLRFIDVRYLLPKRVAFQEALDAEVVAGGSLKNDEERPRDADLKTPTTSTRVDEMRFSLLSLAWAFQAAATILENGQERLNPYPGQAEQVSVDDSWKSYGADASEISYKGRWDSTYTSWWSVPGVKFGFTGDKLAVSFGEHTSKDVLVAYRIGGLDWEFSNVTANSAYQFVEPGSSALNETEYTDHKTFELRVQIDSVYVASDARLVKAAEFNRTVEIIGDSLASGQYATYEGLASWGFNFAAGLGNAEYTITAYPGICLVDKQCYGGDARGMTYQWSRASDVGDRANAAFGDKPEAWNFTAHRVADLVIINLGTNDARTVNNVPSDDYYQSYVKMVENVHGVWPDAQIVLMSLWGNFIKSGSTWVQETIYESEVQKVYQHFEKNGYVHYFDTKGILQHNDISPGGHPTDFGHLKIASHLMQWTKIKLGWEFGATGPEVQHDTTYWNNQDSYKRSVFSDPFI
ncbi:major facilitator superfamily MFS_1 [Aspergillus oryzae]|nr:major facilitator superfamily MFS_1 [Aspergillus oryzae]